MLFQIKGRRDGLVKCEVEITAAHNASEATKLGKAVLAALSAGANLVRANLYGANLDGANLGKEVGLVKRVVAAVTRSDGYAFIGFEREDGTLGIVAGCQYRTVASYRKHVTEYTQPGKVAETTEILDFLERRLAAPVWTA